MTPIFYFKILIYKTLKLTKYYDLINFKYLNTTKDPISVLKYY